MPFPASFDLSSLSSGGGEDGFVLLGAANGDHAGVSVSAGDVNGDGISDLIIGAYGADDNAGASYVVFGHSAEDPFAAVFELASLASGGGGNGFVIKGTNDDEYAGRSVSAAGDVNGDGVGDLIVGAPGTDGGTGASYVVFGHSAGIAFDAELALSSLSAGGGAEGFVLEGGKNDGLVGFSVSAAGDVNGDLIDDLIIGAWGTNGSAGASYVVFGRGEGNSFDAVLELSSLSSGGGEHGFVIMGEGVDFSGLSVSAAGDVNGDGIGDLIVGAPYGANGGTGAAYVVFGRGEGDPPFDAEFSLSSLSSGGGEDGFVLNGASDGDLAGYSVSAAGDVNGDGIGDLIVGAYKANGYVGASYVVFGHSEGVPFDAVLGLASLATGNGEDGFVINGVAEYDYAGFSVSAAGDVNGDGIGDLIVGAHGVDDYAGASYVVFGRGSEDPFAAAFELSSLSAGGGKDGFILNGVSEGDEAGFSVSAAGDVNGDGIDDLVVGAVYTGKDRGSAYVLFGRAPPTVDALATDDQTPTITGTAVLHANQVLTVTVDGTQYAVGDGNLSLTDDVWSLILPDADSLPIGTYDVTATIADTVSGTSADDMTVGELMITAPPPPDLPTVPVLPPPPNQPPAAGDDAYAVDRNGVLTVAGPGLLANDGDPDGDDLLITGLADGPDHGILSWTAEGGFTYQPNTAFSGTDAFIYQVSDGEGGTDTATATITVQSPSGELPSWPVTGSFGDEHFAGTNRDDTVYGMDGNDTISGDGGRDQLNGNTGNDLVEGGPDEDVVWGGQGDDWVLGGTGADWVLGDRGDDIVHGGKGGDQLWGGQGHDRLFGDDGDDRLSGDFGNDTLTGGAGADRFVYAEGGGLDRILDHDLMGGDVIELAVGPDGVLNGIPIGSVEDVLARLVDGPEGTFLPLGDGQGILIEGIAKNQLSADDFALG